MRSHEEELRDDRRSALNDLTNLVIVEKVYVCETPKQGCLDFTSSTEHSAREQRPMR